MLKTIQCAVNISEGRNDAVVRAVAEAAGDTPGVILADCSSDQDHNRSVISLLGPPEAIAEAVFALAGKALELIDLTKHLGEHPRIGAVDVIPFTPIKNCSMEECIALSKTAAVRISGAYGLPVYLYENSASSPDRKNLANVRRGGFEKLAARMKTPGWAPDFGGPEPHPTAGAVAIGARRPLVAFNINLNTPDIDIARAIAKKIRASSGGFEGVKAIGIMLEKPGKAQVSINMTDLSATPVYRVLDAVRAQAAILGTSVKNTEIIGLAPMDALIDAAAHYMGLEGFHRDGQVLEKHL